MASVYNPLLSTMSFGRRPAIYSCKKCLSIGDVRILLRVTMSICGQVKSLLLYAMSIQIQSANILLLIMPIDRPLYYSIVRSGIGGSVGQIPLLTAGSILGPIMVILVIFFILNDTTNPSLLLYPELFQKSGVFLIVPEPENIIHCHMCCVGGVTPTGQPHATHNANHTIGAHELKR